MNAAGEVKKTAKDPSSFPKVKRNSQPVQIEPINQLQLDPRVLHSGELRRLHCSEFQKSLLGTACADLKDKSSILAPRAKSAVLNFDRPK